MALMMLAASAAIKGFHTSGQKLLDGNDNEFILRGCNYSYAWQRGHEASVIPAAKRIGCNAIRIQLGTGAKYQKCTADNLRRLIQLCEDNKLVLILNTHDETGSDNISDLMNAVNYWIEMKDILNEHAHTVILNVSNEWCGKWDASLWAEGYLQAIPALRKAGIKNTLLVDAAGWGQWPNSVNARGKDVAASDPDKNIMFSVHIYDTAGANDYKARSAIDYTLGAGVPAVVGEFAYRHKYTDVAYQAVMDYCAEKGVGYMVWSWTGNGQGAEDCDMFGSYDDSQWRQNGTLTVKGPNGIQATAKECSVFSKTPGQDSGNQGNQGGDQGDQGSNGDKYTWTGSSRLGNWGTLVIPASYISFVKGGMKIDFTFTVDNGADENNNVYGKIIFKSPVGEWSDLTQLQSTLTNVNAWGAFEPGTTTASATLDATTAANIAANGFAISGWNVTVTKIVFNPSGTEGGSSDGNTGGNGDESVLVSPNKYFSSWDDAPYNIPAEYFSGASANDKLLIYYSADSGAELQLAYCDSYNNDKWTMPVEAKKISGEGHETQELATILPHVKKSGFFVKGQKFKFVKATLVHASSGIDFEESVIVDNSSVDSEQPCEIYNLQGLRVTETHRGCLYIVRQGNKVSKVVM